MFIKERRGKQAIGRIYQVFRIKPHERHGISAYLQLHRLKVVGDEDGAGKFLGRLGGVELAAMGKVRLLGVVDKEPLCTERLRQGGGLPGGAVELFVGVEFGFVGVQAEGLAHEQIGVMDVSDA